MLILRTDENSPGRKGAMDTSINYGESEGMTFREVFVGYLLLRQAAKGMDMLEVFDDVVNRSMAYDPDEFLEGFKDDESAGV